VTVEDGDEDKWQDEKALKRNDVCAKFRVDMQAKPSTHQIFNVPPENLEAGLPPSSCGLIGGHTTEIEDVDVFSQAINEPELSTQDPARSAQMKFPHNH
jgi:hypothetical protein